MTTDLIGLPSSGTRHGKAAFRQLRGLYADLVSEERRSRPDTALRVLLRGGPAGLGDSTSSLVGYDVASFDEDPPPAVAHHVVGWRVPEDATTSTRLRQLRDLLPTLRPASLLIVVATVVTDETTPSAPSLSNLLAELALASGGALYAEDVRSLRWPGERLVRGVCLSLRFVGTAS